MFSSINLKVKLNFYIRKQYEVISLVFGELLFFLHIYYNVCFRFNTVSPLCLYFEFSYYFVSFNFSQCIFVLCFWLCCRYAISQFIWKFINCQKYVVRQQLLPLLSFVVVVAVSAVLVVVFSFFINKIPEKGTQIKKCKHTLKLTIIFSGWA